MRFLSGAGPNRLVPAAGGLYTAKARDASESIAPPAPKSRLRWSLGQNFA
jgi:hypothetical protein